MSTVRNRWLCLTAAFAAAGVVSCTETASEEVVGQSDGGVSTADVVEEARVDQSTIEIAFEGTWDPATDAFSIETTHERFVSPYIEVVDGEVVTIAQENVADADFCRLRVTSAGGDETLTLAADPASICFAPEDCGYPNSIPYSVTGMFAADITVSSFFSGALTNVYAAISTAEPEDTNGPYASPYGNAANPASIPGGNNSPADALAAFAYGDIASGGSATEQWTFKYAAGTFYFAGYMSGEVTEVCNGVDDDCDGVIDERSRCYNLGDTCEVAEDCASFNCNAGVCDTPLPEVCNAAGDEDGDGFEGCDDLDCSGLTDPDGNVCPDTASCSIDEVLGAQFGTFANTTDGAGNDYTVRMSEDYTYYWTVPATGDYSFDLSGSSFDTYMTIYEGDCSGALIESDDDDGAGTTSRIDLLNLTAGDTYRIVVEAFSTSIAGEFQLQIAFGGDETDFGVGACFDGLDNDGNGVADCEDVPCFGVDSCPYPYGSCNSPVTITTAGTYVFDPSDAYAVESSAATGCTSTGASDGVERVFAFTPSNSGTINLTSYASNADTVMFARTGQCDDDAQTLQCSDDSAFGNDARMALNVTSGETYYVVVDTFAGASDDIYLRVEFPEGFDTSCSDGQDNDGDGDIDCDDSSCASDVLCAYGIPYSEDFEATNGEWFSVDGDWEWGTPAQTTLNAALEGSSSWMTGLSANYANSTTHVVQSPVINSASTTNDLVVSFTMQADIEATWDEFTFQYSINGGASWLEPAPSGAGTWTTDSGSSCATGQDNCWEDDITTPTVYSTVLPGTAGVADFRMRFELAADGSTNSEGIAFDAISLVESSPEVCDDSTDNDFDGAIDCADDQCFASGLCPEVCDTAGLDEDNDGDADCADSDCAAEDACIIIDTFPYAQDFESGAGGWSDASGLWEVGAPADGHIASAASGTNAFVTDLDGDYLSNTNATLMSPVMDMSSLTVDPVLQFAYIADVEANWDVVTLSFSTDDCATGTALATYDGTQPFGSVASYTTESVELTNLAGLSSVRLCLNLTSDSSGNYEGFAFDDVNILIPETEICDDSIDQDYDGNIDCNDTDCQGDPACSEVCLPGTIDEDGDGALNCADSDCTADASCVTLVTTFPYAPDFETSTGGLIGDNDWEYGEADEGANTGTYGWATVLSGNYTSSTTSNLVTPQLDASALSSDLAVTYSLYLFQETNWDQLEVEYSIDGGGTYTSLESPSNTSGFATKTHTLTGSAGASDVLVRWRMVSDSGVNYTGAVIDDFAIFVTGAEDNVAACGDGYDNDLDGATDCAAASCYTNISCPEVCDGGGNDEDGDTAVDCLDSDCWVLGGSCAEVCDSGNDEDGDGNTDCADSDCDFDAACVVIATPYTASFETGDQGWTVNSGDWEVGVPDLGLTATDGTQAFVTAIGGNYTNGTLHVVTSPAIDASASAADLGFAFDLSVDVENGGWDEFWMEYSVDGGTTWTTPAPGAAGGWTTDVPTSCPSAADHCWEDDISPATTFSTILPGTAGQADVRLRVTLDADSSGNAPGIAFDNVVLEEPPAEDCANGTDDDYDGAADCADSGCWFSGTTCVEVCSGGNDEDGDGDVDCADSDCSALDECFTISTFPHTEDFESGTNYWTTVTNAGTGWELGQAAGTVLVDPSATNNAWVTGLAGDYAANSSATLFSPKFDFSANAIDPVISFDFMSEIETNWDDVTVGISITGGACTGISSANGIANWEDPFDSTITSVTRASATATGAGGEADVRFCFALTSDSSGQREGFWLDNLEVTVPLPEDCSNGTDDDGDGAVDCSDSGCWDEAVCDTTLPYSESFESGSNGWVVTNGLWEAGTPAKTHIVGASDGSNAMVTGLTGDYPNSTNTTVLSPRFDFSADAVTDPILRFDHVVDIEATWDGLILGWSTDDGATCTPITTYDGTASATPASYTTQLVTVTGAAGESNVRFCWNLVTDFTGSYEGYAFDDVFVAVPGPEVCGNGADDDLDNNADCSDSDCFGDAGCPAITTLPYTTDFESDNGDWAPLDATWQFGTPSKGHITGANSGSNAWVTLLSGNYSSNTDATIVSPEFDFTGASIAPIFRYSAVVDVETNWDLLTVGYTTDNGATCNAASTFDGTQAFGTTASYTEYTVNLTGAEGSTARICINLTTDGSGNYEGFAFDDILVDVPAPEVCNDGIDNDYDGATDCADSACFGDPLCPEDCLPTGNDEDFDTLADCDDPDCAADLSCITSTSTFPFAPNFDTESGAFVGDGDWQFGAPAEGAATGTNTWSTSLSGNYTSSVMSTLTSIEFDASGETSDLKLAFDLYLFTETCCDEFYTEYTVDSGNTWTTLADEAEANPAYATRSYVLTGSAGVSDVQVRFRMDPDSSVTRSGANIDNFVVDVSVPEVSAALCGDGQDNDGDGAVDCDDSDCFATGICAEVCTGGLDEDNDTLADCDDSDCWVLGGSCAEVCDGGNDEDGDGDVDCDDSDCDFDANCIVITTPYTQDFELGAQGWTGNGDWELGTPAQTTLNAAPSGSNAWMTNLTANYSTSTIGYVTSPTINASGATNDLVFAFSLQADVESGGWDEFYVQFSIDEGATWTAPAPSPAGDWTTDVPFACPSSVEHCWEDDTALGTFTTVLPGTAGEASVRVRIGLDSDGSGTSEGVLFDDISLTEVPDEVCDDSTDNDFDGSTDCADSDCDGQLACIESVCDDGIDDELDGAIDCFDSDCLGTPECTKTGPFDFVYVQPGTGIGFCTDNSWTLTDATSTEVATNPGMSTDDTTCDNLDVTGLALADGCYTLTIDDFFGDGWNMGGALSFRDGAGDELEVYGLSDGFTTSYTIAINAICP